MASSNLECAPKPKMLDGILGVPIDIQSIDAHLTFDGSTVSRLAMPLLATPQVTKTVAQFLTCAKLLHMPGSMGCPFHRHNWRTMILAVALMLI